MTQQILEVNSCKRNLAVELPVEEIDQEIDKLAREYARKAKLPGFRPGKVPLSVIRQRYGNDLLQDATQRIIERSWRDAISEYDLHPLTQPVLQDVENSPGKPLKFTLVFEVLPALEVKDYKAVPVTVSVPPVTDEAVNEALESLREQHAQFAPVEGEAQDGHYLSLTVDGHFEDRSKPVHDDDISLILGHPQTYPGFSENLRGARVGETRTFEICYPVDFRRERFAGKKVRYTMTVKEIKEKQLPDLHDEFAKDLGAENLDALRSKVRDELVTQAERRAEENARESVLDSIVQQNSVEVPECMVEEELGAYARRLASELAQRGVDANQPAMDWKKILEQERPRIEQRIRRSIILGAIAQQEGIEVTDHEIDLEFGKLAEGSDKSAAALRVEFEKDERIQRFTEHLRQNKALDFVYRNANICLG